MIRLLSIIGVVGLSALSPGLGGESTRPEQLGAHWARVSDKAQIQLIIDELRSVAGGAGSERIARKHVAPGIVLPSPSGVGVATSGPVEQAEKDVPAITVEGNRASAELPSGKTVQFEKVNNTWRVTGGTVDAPQANSAGTVAARRTARRITVGTTFITTPVSPEHNIDRLSRSVTRSKLDRALFGIPDKTGSYYTARYTQTAPFVSATYLQFVTDPEWNRIVYGNLNRWIKSYDDVAGPSAIAVDADGRVFVGETGSAQVSVLHIVGEGDNARLQPLFVITGVQSPNDIALNDNGTPLNTADDILYVADAVQNKVVKFAVGPTSASPVASFEGFSMPTSVAVGKWNGANNNLVYVVDKVGKRIRVFEDTGAELSLVRELNGTYSQYFKSVKVDHFGNIYVVEHVRPEVFKFTSSLDLLDSEGGDGAYAALNSIDIPFGKIVIEGQGTYWTGFDQLFAIERWAEASGAQRRTLGLSLRDIDFHTDADISIIDNTFTLTDFGELEIHVYDRANHLVRDLGTTWMVSGLKNIRWNRRNDAGLQVLPGTYRYEIKARSPYRHDPTISLTEFYLPAYYWENCGSSNPADDAHLVQGSPVVWGSGPSEKANEHPVSVQYRFTGLNPESEYEIAAEYVAHNADYRTQDMTASGVTLHERVRVTRTPDRIGYMKLPRETYATGEVTININRRSEGTAVVSQLWFRETGVGFAPQQVTQVIPQSYELEQNYPNPFNPSTVIRYSIPEDGPVTLKVYNMIGQEVTMLVDAHKTAGMHEVQLDATGKGLSSGVYFYQIKSGEFSATKKMVLIK
jgi:hypothetical protein